MSVVYTPPGVTIQEFTSPSIAPLLAVPGSVCLIGLGAGALQRTDPIVLNGTTPSVLPGVPSGSTMTSTSVSSVMDATNPSNAPSGYSSTTDYTFNSTYYSIARQVTSNTLNGAISAGAGAITLTAGPVPSAGQVVSIGNAPVTFTGGTTLGSNIISNISSFTGLVVGQTVTVTGIAAGSVVLPGGTVITSINNNAATITVSNTALSTTTTSNLSAQLSELATVQSVSGQTVTLTSTVVYNHSNNAAVTWGVIPDGELVYISYTYTPNDYFQPIRLNSMADIQARFGNAWDATGTQIGSTLSHAAMIAFENGASNVVLQPFYVNTNGVRVQPTASQFANSANWGVVYNGLRDFEDINIIVPVVGQSQPNMTDAVQLQLFQTLQDHIEYQKQQGFYLIGVLGEDASASSAVAQEATLVAHAQTLIPRYGMDVTQQLVLLNSASFTRANRIGQFNVGGQYAAAAIAGMLSSFNVSSSLTRKVISGINGVNDIRTKDQKNNDASNGLLVIEQKGNVVQIRHAITMDNTTVATQEISVVRTKHRIVESLRITLETQVIGQISAGPDAATLINNVVIATLEALRTATDLVSYNNVQTRQLSTNPTVFEVRFSYQPEFPIDYINIGFSLDLTNGAISSSVSSSGVGQ